MCRSLQIIWTQSLLSAKLYFQRPVQEERAHKVEAVIDELDPSSAKNLDQKESKHDDKGPSSSSSSFSFSQLFAEPASSPVSQNQVLNSVPPLEMLGTLLTKVLASPSEVPPVPSSINQCVPKSKSPKTNKERNHNDKIQQAMRMTSYQGTNKSCHWKSMGTRLLKW